MTDPTALAAQLVREFGFVDDTIGNSAMVTSVGTVKELVAVITRAIQSARLDGMETGAKVVEGLIGKDSGNWNRAIIHAAAAIRENSEIIAPIPGRSAR